MNQIVNAHELKQKLENGVVTVVFTKADGSERTMNATLADEYVPKQLLVENVVPGVFTVWDMDKKALRAFRVDSIKSVR